MATTLSKTYNEALKDIVDQYRSSGNKWPATKGEIGAWALETNLWEAPREFLIQQCANDIGRAMAEVKHTDPQGRSVRTLVAATTTEVDEEGVSRQITIWDDIRDGSSVHLATAAKMQRKQIIGDCRSLNSWVQSANENNENLRNFQIQLSWDFTEEVIDIDDDEPLPRKPR